MVTLRSGKKVGLKKFKKKFHGGRGTAFQFQAEAQSFIYLKNNSDVDYRTPFATYKNFCDIIKQRHRRTSSQGEGRSGEAFDFEIDHQHLILKESFGSELSMQEFMQSCVHEPGEEYTGMDSKKYKLSRASFICTSPLTEYMISKLCGDFFSINFLKMYQFELCENEYTLMEKSTTTLLKFFQKNVRISRTGDPFRDENEKNAILFQVLHALACMQNENVKIVHGDLHLDNIFLTEITDETLWHGQLLRNFSHLEYRVENRSFFVPLRDMRYIVKIADFGYAAKYAEPVILNPIRNKVKLIPDYFAPAYDLGYFIFSLGTKTYWDPVNYPSSFSRFFNIVRNFVFPKKLANATLDHPMFVNQSKVDKDYYRSNMNMDTRRVNDDFPITVFDVFANVKMLENMYKKPVFPEHCESLLVGCASLQGDPICSPDILSLESSLKRNKTRRNSFSQ
jgi:serine/threonine protein kinase